MVATAVPTIVPTIVSQDMAGIGVKARFADGAYTGASACSVDYGGVWTDFAGGVAPIVTVGGRRYLQMETAKENQHTEVRSSDDDDWFKFNCTISADADNGPDGNASADKIVEDLGVAERHFIQESVTTVDTIPFCHSFYAKPDERSWFYCIMHGDGFPAHVSCNFDVGNGVIGTNSTCETKGIDASVNSYYRCYQSDVSDASVGGVVINTELSDGDEGKTYNGDGSSGAFVWNRQFEIGYFPSSPINSGVAATTRAKDEFLWLEADVPNGLRGKITFNWICNQASGYMEDVTLCEWDESGASHNIRVWYDATDQKIYVDDETDVVTLVVSDALTITRGDNLKITLDPDNGGIKIAGATAGDCDNTNTAWSTSAGDVYWGNNEANGEQCEGMISEPR